jgi:cbb3-type cytochrome oxidase subunit 1
MLMKGLAARFFATAVVYSLLAMTLGLVMGMTQDHTQMPTHAHLALIGWVSFALYGVFYHLFPDAAARPLAVTQFWFAQAGFVVLIVGLFLIFRGVEAAEPLAAIGSLGILISAVLFAVVALPTLRLGSTA